MGKLFKWDIYGIKAGTTKKFQMDDYRDVLSIKAYLYGELNRLPSKPGDVEKYTTRYDYENKVLYVTAHKKETV